MPLWCKYTARPTWNTLAKTVQPEPDQSSRPSPLHIQNQAVKIKYHKETFQTNPEYHTFWENLVLDNKVASLRGTLFIFLGVILTGRMMHEIQAKRWLKGHGIYSFKDSGKDNTNMAECQQLRNLSGWYLVITELVFLVSVFENLHDKKLGSEC